MTDIADQILRGVINLAETDTNVLGFVLCGSRGKCVVTQYSDCDCAMIVKDESLEQYLTKISDLPPTFDMSVYTLREFADHAAWGGPFSWDRYNWAHLRALVDKTDGEIQLIIDEKGRVPASEVGQFVRTQLDHYTNQIYRSIKCLRDGAKIGYRFEAAASIAPLLDVMFAIHSRRLRPYYKYLEWELIQFPLYKFSWRSEELVTMLGRIIADGDYETQQRLFREVENVFRGEGYGEVFDSWGNELWIRDFSPITKPNV